MILEGKTVNFLGDSITEGAGVTDRSNNRFDNVLKRECKLAATYNYGIGGTRIAHQRIPSDKPRHDLYFCGRVYDINHNADMVIVFGGTNDYGHGDAPFGSLDDKTPQTFCGAVNFLMSYLSENFVKKGKTVVFLTPARRTGDENIPVRPEKSADAQPLIKYVDVILELGARFGIHVYDMYRELGINPNSADDKADYTTDGLHFNDAGHAIIASKVKAFLESL